MLPFFFRNDNQEKDQNQIIKENPTISSDITHELSKLLAKSLQENNSPNEEEFQQILDLTLKYISIDEYSTCFAKEICNKLEYTITNQIYNWTAILLEIVQCILNTDISSQAEISKSFFIQFIENCPSFIIETLTIKENNVYIKTIYCIQLLQQYSSVIIKIIRDGFLKNPLGVNTIFRLIEDPDQEYQDRIIATDILASIITDNEEIQNIFMFQVINC